jgi:hypothetical protein
LNMAKPSHECTCSALFPTIDALKSHVAEYQSFAGNLERIIDRCKDHSVVDEQSNRTTALLRHCPDSRCKRTKEFSKRKEVRTHYRKHVGCNEVCLCCGEKFRWASDFLRHVPDVDEMDSMQNSFMLLRRRKAVEKVDRQLTEVLERKRKRDQEDEDEDTGRTKRVKPIEIYPTGNEALEKAELDLNLSAPVHDINFTAVEATTGAGPELSLGAPVHDIINFTAVEATTGAGPEFSLGAPIHSTINFTSFRAGQDMDSYWNLSAPVHNVINFTRTGTATEAELDLYGCQ